MHDHEKEVKEYPEKLGDEDDDFIWVTEFDEESAKDFTEQALRLSSKDPARPLLVYIDSYGGMVDSLATMISVLDSVPNKIVTVCMGKAMSCGAMLLSHGDERFVAPYGRVMVHEMSDSTMGNVNDVKVDAAELTRMNEQWMDWLAKNCGTTVKQLSRRFTNKKRNVFLTPDQAIKFGLADKVGVPKIQKIVRYEIE